MKALFMAIAIFILIGIAAGFSLVLFNIMNLPAPFFPVMVILEIMIVLVLCRLFRRWYYQF